MKVTLLVPLAGPRGVYNVGDLYECSPEEAKRFEARGIAKKLPAPKKPRKAVEKKVEL
jgi:hypothetical protein